MLYYCTLHALHCQEFILFFFYHLPAHRPFCLLNASRQSRTLTVQADYNNRARLGTSRSRHDASPRGGRRNVLTTSPQENEKRIDVATRATVLRCRSPPRSCDFSFSKPFLPLPVPTGHSEYSTLRPRAEERGTESG